MQIPNLHWTSVLDQDGAEFHIEWAFSDWNIPPGEGGKGRLRLNTEKLWFRIPEHSDPEWRIAFETSRM